MKDRNARVGLASSLPLLLMLFGLATHGKEMSLKSVRRVVAESKRSLVLVRGVEAPEEERDGRGETRTTSAGAGFFVGDDGEVLTSLYAVCGSRRIEVLRPGGSPAPAKLLAVDQAAGLALLKTGLNSTPSLAFSDADPQVGQWLLAAEVAQPGADGGVVASFHPVPLVSLEGEIMLRGVDWEGLVVARSFGASCSALAPLLNAEGRLAALLIAVKPGEQGGARWFCIPADRLSAMVAGLREGNSRRLGWLGVALSRNDQADGVTVEGVIRNSPAARAGIRPGDVLLKIGERSVRDVTVLQKEITGTEPGSRIVVKLSRDEKKIRCMATVDERPFLISRRVIRVPVRQKARWQPVRRRRLLQPRRPFVARVDPAVMRQNRLLRRRVRQLEAQIRQMEQQMQSSWNDSEPEQAAPEPSP